MANIYYENFFSLEELQKINIAFFSFQNINNIISKAKNIFEEKKINMKFEKNNMLLMININKDNKSGDLISLELIQKKYTLEEICINLCKEVSCLKKIMSEKDKENKNNINELKNEIQILKKEINHLKNGRNFIQTDITETLNIQKEQENNELKLEKPINNEIITIDSLILIKQQEIDFITNRIRYIEQYKNKKISYRLLYRKTQDGDQSQIFHKKCDGVPKTISIFKTVKGCIFGGYIDKAWNSIGGWVKNDELCFIFSINLMKIYNPVKGMDKYYFHKNYGPNFSEFGLYNHIVGKNSFILSVNLKNKDDANKYFTGFNKDFELNGGENKFQIGELEVYQVIFQ